MSFALILFLEEEATFMVSLLNYMSSFNLRILTLVKPDGDIQVEGGKCGSKR